MDFPVKGSHSSAKDVILGRIELCEKDGTVFIEADG
jgi:hypothetical protein